MLKESIIKADLDLASEEKEDKEAMQKENIK